MAETGHPRSSGDGEVPSSPQEEGASQSNGDRLTTVDLETALSPRHHSAPRRRMRALLALTPFLALVVIILVTIFGRFPIALPHPPFGQNSSGPAPVAGVAQQFTITSDVNYGTIALNGKLLSGALPLNVTLPPGYDTITLSAPPFNPISCEILSQYEPVIVYKGQASENSASCAIGGSFTASSLYSLYMPLTGDSLPANQLTQAQGALAQALTQLPVYTATVPPGQYYATGIDRHGLPIGQRATEPLRATLSVVLPSTGQNADPVANPYDCPSHICSALTLLVPSSSSHGVQSQSWHVAAAVALHWRFTTTAGRVVGESTEDSAGPLDFVLTYDPQSGWRVSAAPPSAPANAIGSIAHALDPCILGDNLVTFDAPNLGIETLPAPSKLGIMRGCLFQTNSNEGAAGSHYLYRFGVALAADAAAHTQLPSLPIAPSDEIAAVAA